MEWLDDLREGVVLVEAGRVTRVNRAAGEFLQVDPEASIGKPLIAVLRDHRIESVVLEQRPVELEARSRRLLVRPIRGGLSLEDVTMLRSREEEARDLLAVLSHELRTPVATIQSTLEALSEDLPADRRMRFLQRALREGERLVRLLDDLTIDVAPPAARTVLVADVVDRAMALLEPVLAARHVEVRRTGSELSAWVDPDKMLQVVLNLLENAAIHGPAGSVIDVEQRPSPDGSLAILTVRDRGAPLRATAFEGLFAPHRRGGGASSKGSGLGLYIVKSIAERAGGRAWGEPTVNGNAFSVAIPRASGRQEGSTGSVS